MENGADITLGGTWTGSNTSPVIFETADTGRFLTSSAIPTFSGTVTGSSFTSTFTVVNGVLMQGANTGARANLYVIDDSGVGFATQNGANEIVRFTGATALPSGSGATLGTDNYTMSSSVTRTANLNFATLSIDTGSSAGSSVDLSLGGADFDPTTSGGTGRSILITGVNNSTVTANRTLGSINVSNFGTGMTTLAFSMNNNSLVSSGSGLLNYANAFNPGDVFVYNGTLRFSANMNYTGGNIRISSGGVFEIGADLSNTTDGDFIRALGTGIGQVQLLAGAGFSAHGADRIVALGGVATPTAITWGASNFLAGTNERLIFGSSASNATLEFRNAIDLNNAQRIIEVKKGVGANLVEARMTGVLSGGVAGTTPSGLTKTGLGTLELTGENTYGGPTYVAAGTLLVNNASGSGLGTGNVTVVGGKLGGTGSFTGSVVVAAGGTLAPGASIATLESGALSFTASSTFAYEVDSDVALAVGADLQKVTGNLSLDGVVTLTLANLDTTPVAFALGTTFSLINYTGTWNGGLFTVNGNAISNNGTFSALGNTWQLTYNAAEGGLNFSGEYFGGSDSFVNIVAVPEPSTWALLALGLTAVAVLRRRRLA